MLDYDSYARFSDDGVRIKERRRSELDKLGLKANDLLSKVGKMNDANYYCF
jgi:hypothetical protein